MSQHEEQPPQYQEGEGSPIEHQRMEPDQMQNQDS
jgi:Calpain family cysteine protease